MTEDKNGNLWLATWNDGVFRYDGKSFTNFTKDKGVAFNEVRSILEDKTGNIWIGGKDGLFKYDGENLINVANSPISNIYEDSKGNLWLIADDTAVQNINLKASGGMVLYRYDGKSFTRIIAKNNSMICGIIEDKAGNS